MKYQLAQLNIAKFKEPMEHPQNADFVNNLDRVNALAENSPGFVWRLVGEENNALDLNVFDDPNVAINMSVWQSKSDLYNFVYKNKEHLSIMKRRKEWFEKMRVYLVLWWVEAGHIPTTEEAKVRLEMLEKNGPSQEAFTFAQFFDAPAEKTD